ncbi:MAG: hypothetical protein NTU79_03100, partial [Planctomycetota bacterium]|nr:hypothetical protein [Planctomycetota bacterium]
PWSQGEGEKTRWVHANSLGFRVWRATSVGKDKAIARRLSVCFTRRLIPMCLACAFWTITGWQRWQPVPQCVGPLCSG